MNRYLLVASLFFCNIFSANDEILTTESTTEIVATTFENAYTELAETATTEVETVIAETENVIASEFASTSVVFDFVMELETLTQDWLHFINSTRTLITRCQNSEEENSTEATLHLAQAIYKHAVSNENNAHGNLCISLYETDSNDVSSEIESIAPHYIAFRLVVARNNDSNPALWTIFQKMVQAVLAALQATQTTATEIAQAAELAQEEIQAIEASVETAEAAIQNNDATSQENLIATISSTVQELLTLAKEDNNKSVSTRLYINAVTNNTAE